ncbi:N-6 DNA methylase [Defluviimonas salinarum]|uniref:N-6 DNA methylase n=1 Tax=Defluviimonas salinarum TaxID=2992147 RepID=A0ABT3J9Q3_9RHOB|nr:N-6 DNA methylase [Defluviimonas salinarum]MCW3784423.1 N-6 DNA methylase [Defluviimonas salinarum]
MNRLIRDTNPVKAFEKLFQETARYRHRYELFRDFVFLSAAALHNSACPDPGREAEYLATVRGYKREDVERLPEMLSLLVAALEPEPRDVLGQIFMDLELGDARRGQFFTPPNVSRMMAEMLVGDLDSQLAEKPFLTLSEPACGAGGMVLAVVAALVERGVDPARRLWVQAIDVDRTAALMAYIQLSLWNVPAEIVVGNAITLETREVWLTPAYHLFGWHRKLARQDPHPVLSAQAAE